ncbi:hypothetical protein OH782_00125 [Streptomyces sp. NBC_01544]|uniref:hypothetical protein n=1 Tax=Streptomyces sp. NBC_01544 TaxID=2975871 RepID=UPI00386EB0DC
MDLESRERLLQSAGLTVLDPTWSGDVPGPMEAWRLIIGGEVTPSAVVHFRDGNEHLDEVESRWESIAERNGLFDSRDEFFISVAGVGSVNHPWARVRRNPGLSLAHILAPSVGEPEFVAMSIDGRVVCGVTTEEYDVWIVFRDFT